MAAVKSSIKNNLNAAKAAERRLAARLRGKRTPLSGRNGGAGTSGDYVPLVPGRQWLYAEFKHYTRAAIFTLMHDTEAKAKREGRHTAVVVMAEKRTQNVYALIPFEHYTELLDKVDRNGTERDIR